MTRLQDSPGSATIAHVEYRVLGPLSAYLDGVPQKLGGRRQRTVLAVLVARANTVVAQDALIDAVWAGNPPETAKQTLHTYVSTLRKALGGEIERDGDGYVLRVDRSDLDAARFEDLSGEARQVISRSPVDALAPLQEALGLWHGPAFGDLGGEPALINEVIRLEEARLTALELRVESDLAVGNHAAVVQELEALTHEHPFRERLRGFLMLALYRSGRQADALRVYRETRLFLAEELGIDPSPELQELEEQILNHDPGLDWLPVDGESREVERAARGYELRERVGEGPFGITYRGFQSSVGREVTVLAIEGALANEPPFVRRFEPELRAVSILEHPHIAPLYDFWRDPDGAYLVTAHLRGGTLRTSLELGPWNLSSTLRLVDQVSSALAYAHRNGFVHGSLGLDSISLDEDLNAYVCDFGLAELTHVDSAGDRSSALDVYDLAAVVFTVLTGQPTQNGARTSTARPDLIELDNVFLRARHPDPDSRYQKPEDLRRALRQAAGADVVAATAGTFSTSDRRNPYKGLRAFHEPDAADFHGRDALVEELVESLSAAQLVTVVGPSGSGKSSLVRAGLVPALRQDAIDGSGTWLVTEMFPGTHPFEEMEAALIRVAVDRPPGLFDELTSDPRGLARVAKQVLSGDDDELVLIIDQFEELFSLVSSESVRTMFLDALAAAASDERSRIRIVLTLRADFFDQPLQYAGFGEVMRRSLVAVSPPTEDGLARAIAQPARDVGVDLEPGLVTRIVDDVRSEPGGLPLMQYALTELFASREHNTLTLAGYAMTGGVVGALANRGEEIYRDLSVDGKEAARQLFLRLVTVDELADDTRRRVRQTELRSLGIQQDVLDDVMQQFGSFRLLSFDRDGATRTPTVEVAHEALIREWDRLRTWIDERREDLLIHRRIQMTVRDWEESGGDASYLLRGSRLEQALLWQERTDIAISDEEMTFIEASIETEKREEAEREALEEKAARRRKALIGVLAGGLVVSGILGALAIDRAREASIMAAEATSRDLAASAMDALVEDPELAVLLSLESLEATERRGLNPVPQSISALRSTLPEMRVALRLAEGDGALAISPDGATIAADRSTENGSSIALLEASTGKLGHLITPPEGSLEFVRSLTFSPSGDLLVSVMGSTSVDDASAVSALDLYDMATRRHLMTLSPPSGRNTFRATFSSSGLVAADGFTASGGWAEVWDTNDGKVVFSASAETLRGAVFSPGSDELVVSHALAGEVEGETNGRIEAIDVDTGKMLWSVDTPGIDPQSQVLSPDGSLLAISEPFGGRLVRVIRIPDGEALFTVPHQDPQTLVWSHDGSALAVAGNDGDITLIDIASGAPSLVLTGHQAGIYGGIAFFPDGRHLASAALDGDPRVWNIAPEGSVGRAIKGNGVPAGHSLSPDGSLLFVLTDGEDAEIIDVSSGVVESTFPFPYVNPLLGSVDSSFTRLAGTDYDGQGLLFDLDSGEEIQRFDPSCLAPRALSPDGSLVLLDAGILCTDVPGVSSHVVDIDTDEVVIDLGQRVIWAAVFSGATSPRGGYLVVNINFETIEVYSLDDGRLLGTLGAEEVGDIFLVLSLSADDRYLGIGTNGPRALVVDMEQVLAGTQMIDALALNIEAHKGNTPFVAVTNEGLAVSAGLDGFYRAWDIDTDQKQWEIRVTGLIGSPSVNFNREETELIYEDAGGVIRFTPLGTDQVVSQARSSVTRVLTDDECRQYMYTDGCD